MIGIRLRMIISVAYQCTNWRCWDNGWIYKLGYCEKWENKI